MLLQRLIKWEDKGFKTSFRTHKDSDEANTKQVR